MLMWTLERIGIRAPAVYAPAARQAARLGALDGRRGFEAQAQFQGALAILARMAMVTHARRGADAGAGRTARRAAADRGRPLRRRGRALAARASVAGAIKRADTTELAVLAAMSGAAVGRRPGRAAGDVGRAAVPPRSRRRRAAAPAHRPREAGGRAARRARSISPPAARTLAAEKIAAGDVDAILAKLTAAVDDLPRRVGRDNEDTAPPGVPPAPNAREALRKMIEELTKDVRNKDVKRVARARRAADRAVRHACSPTSLLSIAYAADVGDPDGTVLLADDVSRRHDFGFGARDAETRQRLAWAVPRAEVTPGVPWHVSGSLLGLDIGLAPLALRRLNFERVLEAPRLTSNERDTFALSVSLLNPFDAARRRPRRDRRRGRSAAAPARRAAERRSGGRATARIGVRRDRRRAVDGGLAAPRGALDARARGGSRRRRCFR